MISFKYIKFHPDGKKEYFLVASSKEENKYGSIYFRENGPAVIQADGTKEYYINGNRSRVVAPNGYEEFWTNGKIGRKDGPAVIYPDGGKDWIWNDCFHRKDGPAREYSDGRKQYFYQGKKIQANNDKEFFRRLKLINLSF